MTLDPADRIERIEWRRTGRSLAVRLQTERGHEGLGEASHLEQPDAVAAALGQLTTSLRGRTPFATDENFYEALHRFGYRDATCLAALSALDQACWDVRSRAMGAPLYEVMGGRVRARIQAMAAIYEAEPQAVVEQSRRAVAEGYRKIKVIPFCEGYTALSATRRVGQAAEIVHAVRQAVGPDIDLGVDLHRDFDPASFAAFVGKVRGADPLFFEDPLPPFSLGALSSCHLRGAGLAVGERNFTLWEFRDLSDVAAVTILRADVGLCGGVGQMRRIAAIAESRHQRVWPHNFGGAIATFFHLHLAASITNLDVVEYAFGSIGSWLRGPAQPDAPVGGEFTVPDCIRNAIEFDALPDAIEGSRIVPRATDGGLFYR